MSAIGLLNQAQNLVLQTVAGIAYSGLTDDMLKVLVAQEAGLTAQQRLTYIQNILPPQAARTHIMLPLLTSGPMSEYPLRGHDVFTLLYGLMCSGTLDIKQFGLFSGQRNPVRAQETLDSANRAPGLIKSNPAPLGAQPFYTKAWIGFGPKTLRLIGDAISPLQVWAATGLSPETMSTGFSGMSEIKGTMAVPMSSGPSSVTQAKIAADTDIVKAAAAAASMSEDVD